MAWIERGRPRRPAAFIVIAMLGATGAGGAAMGPGFATLYTVTDLGSVQGVPIPYASMVFQAGNPNVLLLAGAATSSAGEIYTVPVARNAATNHVTSLGLPTPYASAPYIDGGLIYAPNGDLLFTEYNKDLIGQFKPGSSSPDKIVAAPTTASTGSFQIVPAGVPGAGNLIVDSVNSSQFCVASLTADGQGTYNVSGCLQTVTGTGQTEGILYLPAGTPGFSGQTMLVAEYGANQVVAFTVDSQGLPILSSAQVFVSGINGAQGVAIDPVTGDLFFAMYADSGANEIFEVSAAVGSAPPSTDYAGSAVYGLDNDATTGPAACTSGDPVNCATGNLIETSVDLRVAQGRGRALHLVRTYNGLDAATATAPGAMGYGWTHSYASYLTIYASGDVVVHQGNGATVTFILSGSSLTPPAFVIATLVKNADGTYTFTLPNQAADIFSSAGRLVTQTDRNGYQTNLAYDSSGHLVTVTDPSSRKYSFQYGSNGLVSSVTDPIGRTVSYGYDSNLNLTAFTDAGGFVTNYAYDGSHRLTQITDPNGGKTSNVYDTSNRVISQTDPAGRVMTFGYSGSTTTITDGNGNVTSQTYTNNWLTSVTRGAGTSSAATSTFTYDAAGNRVSGTDANGHTTTTTYDARGNQLTRTDALGRKSVFTYDAQNNLLTATDPLNITTTYTYDAHGNLATVSRPTGAAGQAATVAFQYGDSSHPGDLTAITDATGRTWTAAYDANGAIIRSADPAGNVGTITVNGIGWVTGGVTPRGNAPGANAASFTVALAYSPRGDLIEATDQLGHTTTLTYDANRNPLTSTDANGKVTHFAYDADNERVKVTRADGSVWTTAFDAAANMVGQTDGLGRTTSYAYDTLNRRVQTTDPLGRSIRHQFDGAGNLTGFVNASGQTTTFTYDAANQRTGIAYSDGLTHAVAFAYDADGRRASMTDGTGVSTYQYDSLNRMTVSTDGTASQVHYAYDLAGRIVSLTYPSGSLVTRAFDAAGRLAAVTDWLGNTNSFSYDADGNLVKAGYGNGTAAERIYDADDRIASVAYALGGHFLDLGFSYIRDNIGQITSVATIPGATEAYTYSAVNQLSAVNNLTFAADAADNLTQLSSTALTYDAANELMSGAGATFSYNARGDRTQSMSAAGSASYSYDQTDRLTAIGASATYAYNGDGLRMRKTVSGAATPFTWELLGKAPLLLAAGQTQFLYGPGGRPLEQVNPDGSVLWFHQDHQGSTRILTNSEGRIAARYSYSAYGQRSNADGGDDGSVAQTPLLFAGQFTDAESGFEYLHARYYDQSTGQFLTRDPMAGVTRHPYLYANGNPVNGADPTGLDDDAPAPTTVELPTGDDSTSSSTPDTGGFEGPAPAPTPVLLPTDTTDTADSTGPPEPDVPIGIGSGCGGSGGDEVAQLTPAGTGGGTVKPPTPPYQPGGGPPQGPVPEENPIQAASKIANRALGWLEDEVIGPLGKAMNSVLPVIYLPSNFKLTPNGGQGGGKDSGG